MTTYEELQIGIKVKVEAPLKFPHRQEYKKPVLGTVTFRGGVKPWGSSEPTKGVWIETKKGSRFITLTLIELGYVTIVK